MPERICEQCGASYTPTGNRQRFCSTQCTERARPKRANRPYTQTCAKCGQSFRCVNKRAQCKACRPWPAPRPTECIVPWSRCSECRAWFVQRRKAKTCSPACSRVSGYRTSYARQGHNPPDVRVVRYVCTCGVESEPMDRRQGPWACESCQSASRKRAKQTRRARKRGALTERFNAVDIHERDGWRCHLCGGMTKKEATVPHPLAPVLDHVIPIARGGDHLRANVRCAHFICNSTKGASTTRRGEQLLLMG